jgi:hypothetical protein
MKLIVTHTIPLENKVLINHSFINEMFKIVAVTLPFRVGPLKQHNRGFSPIGKN